MINFLSRILGLAATDITEAFVLLGYALGGALAGFVVIYTLLAAGFWVRDRRAASARSRARPATTAPRVAFRTA